MSAESLAGSCDGAAEAIVPAHGFTINQIVELVRAGLASATAERSVAAFLPKPNLPKLGSHNRSNFDSTA
jgi:hypothetical protein